MARKNKITKKENKDSLSEQKFKQLFKQAECSKHKEMQGPGLCKTCNANFDALIHEVSTYKYLGD